MEELELFNKYFTVDEIEPMHGSDRYFVSWTSMNYTEGEDGNIDEDKFDEILDDFVLGRLICKSFNDMIIESNENLYDIARFKLLGFAVLTQVQKTATDVIPSDDVVVALTFDDGHDGFIDRCHTQVTDEYADIIIAEAIRLVKEAVK